jgi:hypothetical protein
LPFHHSHFRCRHPNANSSVIADTLIDLLLNLKTAQKTPFSSCLRSST